MVGMASSLSDSRHASCAVAAAPAALVVVAAAHTRCRRRTWVESWVGEMDAKSTSSSSSCFGGLNGRFRRGVECRMGLDERGGRALK
jgi:hypothetical protein